MCRTSFLLCVSLQRLQEAKNCLSQFLAAPRPPYEPFQRIQVPPAESGWVDPKWVDVFPGYKPGDIPAGYVSFTRFTRGVSILQTSNGAKNFPIASSINDQLKQTHYTVRDHLPFRKLTWQRNIHMFSRKYIFISGPISHCYISFSTLIQNSFEIRISKFWKHLDAGCWRKPGKKHP